MIKRALVVLAATLMALGSLSAPTLASVPDWDTHSSAEWASIATVLDSPEDLAYARNLPASPSALQRKAQSDCDSPGYMCLWNGYSFTGIVWKLPNLWLIDSQVGEGNGLSFNGSSINNTSKGWWNRTPNQVTLFDRDDCQLSGFYRRMTSNQAAVQAQASDADWEDRFSSVSLTVVEGNYCFSDPNQ